MEIRKINENDNLVEIANIYVESWKDVYKGIIADEYLARLNYEKWLPYLKQPPHIIYIALKDNKYIGIVSFDNQESAKSKNGEIYSIYVLPSYQNEGVGKSLLNKAINELKENSFITASIHVIDKNSLARKFYEREHFKLCDESIKEIISNQELILVKYERELY